MGSGQAATSHSGESSCRYDGMAARRHVHAGPIPPQRRHGTGATRA